MSINKVCISEGNRKMGAIPSVSLPACVTCNPDAPCFKLCYARRLMARRSNVSKSYYNNLDILNNDPKSYWAQVKAGASLTRFFRYHVSGDIPNIEYFAEMVKLAKELPGTTFLAFTKQYSIVNKWMRYHKKAIPSNLIIIFSLWDKEWNETVKNPYNFPTCQVVFKHGTDSAENYSKVCGGNCTECACRGVGCWALQHGDKLAILEH